MSSNVVNSAPYIKTSRIYPESSKELVMELNLSYVDIANAVNSRVIGLFPTSRQAITGESWFLSGQNKQQSIRQVYTFTAAGNIPHGLNMNSVDQFCRGFGSYYDGTNYNGVIYGSSTAIAGQCSFYITSTNIVVLLGAGAPAISRGIIVIEWLSKV